MFSWLWLEKLLLNLSFFRLAKVIVFYKYTNTYMNFFRNKMF